MGGFDDVTVEWAGKEYRIPAAKVMPLVARVENLIFTETGADPLTVLVRDARPAMLAMAFEKVLDYVGAPFQPGEVYNAVVGSMIEGEAGQIAHVQEMLLLLLSILNPPAHLKLTAPKAQDRDAAKN